MIKITLDHAGIAQLLKAPGTRAAVRDAATKIAAHVSASITDPDVEVVVDDYTTDRAAASVSVRDVRGQAWQARDGILTRAAGASGLTVKDRR